MKAFLVAALLGLVTVSAHAAPPGERGGQGGRGLRGMPADERQMVDKPRYNKNRAAQIVRDRGGQILQAGDARNEDHTTYRFKVLKDGEVRVIYFDAHTGEMLD